MMSSAGKRTKERQGACGVKKRTGASKGTKKSSASKVLMVNSTGDGQQGP